MDFKKIAMLCSLPVFLLLAAEAYCLTQQEIDEARERLKNNIDHSDIGASYAQLLNFFIEPDISSSYLEVDDEAGTAIDLYKLPLQRTLRINQQGWETVVRGTLSYATAQHKTEIFPDETVDAEWEAFSGNLGAGLVMPLPGHWSALGAADIGLSHLESKARYQGEILQDILAPIVDGIAYNWDTNAWVGSLVLGVDYLKEFTGNYELDVKGRYTYSYVSSFNESRDLPSFSDTTNVVSLKVDFAHPLGFSVADYPIYGVAHLGTTNLLGENRDVLGFDHFFEFGYSLKIDISRKQLPVESLSLGYQWNRGDDVEGYSILLGWEFSYL